MRNFCLLGFTIISAGFLDRDYAIVLPSKSYFKLTLLGKMGSAKHTKFAGVAILRDVAHATDISAGKHLSSYKK